MANALNFIKRATLMGGLIMLSACSGTKESPSPDAIVQTAFGKIQGVTTETDGIFNFKGLPYAQPPTGDLRWRAPKAPLPWSGIRVADSYAPICMQPRDTEDGFFDRIIDGHGLGVIKRFLIKRVVAALPLQEMSEACLALNIRTAHIGKSEKAPVMVWIHGGGHQFGSSDYNYYQSNGLVEKGVVLVTINYRLGVMGYMAHPALSADDPNGVSGNYGTLDQIAALKWIRDNIQAFGGDPENVTIFGESAGGWSITELMASPKAKGLFHKAIGQSGASTYHLGQMQGNPLGWVSGYEVGQQVTEALGLQNPTAQEMRALSAENIQAVITEKMGDGFHHNRDGYVFPQNVGHSFQDGHYNAVPTLFGYNTDEGTLFFEDDPQPSVWIENFPPQGKSEQLLALSEHYPTQAKTLTELYNLEGDFLNAGTQFMGDEIFGVNVRYVTQINEDQGQPAYIYTFGRVPPSAKQTLGAFHAAEIPFVFRSHEKVLGSSEDDIKLTELMTSYWTNFAKYGNPNAENLPNWPLYNGENWMQFGGNNDVKTQVVTQFRKDKLDALQDGLLKKLDDLRAASSLQNSPETGASGLQ